MLTTHGRVLLLTICVLVAASCGSDVSEAESGAVPSVGSAGTSDTPPSTPPIAEVEAAWPDHVVQLLGLRRVSPGILEVRFAVANGRADGDSTDIAGRLAAGPGDEGTVADVFLLDTDRRKKYFVLREADGRPVCSRDLEPLAPGARVELWARFPAPAESTESVDVHVPGAPAFASVALPPVQRDSQ